jgi:glycine/D-amino acid oxidase-like deaminating enzyme/nitrite reductase/ring-hydroxylating ferredoxin subunit
MAPGGSFWLATAPAAAERPPLAGSVDCDVAVLGGGIAGVTTAYLLAAEGADVVLLEAETIGAGATGNTTAKVSSAHGHCYDPIRRRHGAETAAAYAALNERAIAWIEQTAAGEAIDCDWRRRVNYTYSIDAARRADIEEEAKACAEAGLAAELVDDTPLPFDVVGAVRLADQAEFHPVKWLAGLAAAAQRHGARIHERSRALEVSSGSPCSVKTSHGELRAQRVVVATHYPTLDRGLFFARLSAQRSYCVGVRGHAAAPEGMFLSIDSPTRSVRSHPTPEGELLIVGGEGHKSGQEEHTGERYAALESWAAEHFGADAVEYRWSAQDPMPPDELPYVGSLVPRSDRLFVATGFRKWGMTNGTAAAAILRDQLLGRDVGEGATWAANRFDPIAAGPTLVKENLNVAAHLLGDRLVRPTDPDAIAAGQGAIVRRGLRRAAAFRDDAGALHVFGSACTHLGCELRFNDAERSWDCPCHGSRFDALDGRVLEGPAVKPLSPLND